MKRTRLDNNNALLEMLGVVAAVAGVVAVVTPWHESEKKTKKNLTDMGSTNVAM